MSGPASEAKSLADRVAIVTGGSRGIGLAIARSLAEAGASVVVSGRDAARLEAHLLGRASDLGFRRGLVAGDLPALLPAVLDLLDD